MQLVVLNPGGKDVAQEFPDGAGAVDSSVHAPVNYHAYAACTGGSFQRTVDAVAPGPVLLLLRRDLKAGLKALQALKAKGCVVAVSWKESGLHQVGSQLDTPEGVRLFREICTMADGALSSTAELVPLYKAAGARHVSFIPTPYPVEDPRWNFSVPMGERAGILIGTREFDVPSRNHLAAILLASSLGEPVTVFNFDGRGARKKLQALGCAEIIEKRLAYPDYLRVMARHRMVFQLDRSAVPGQVAGDALLCRIPCIGGDGATEQLAFPAAAGLSFEQLRELGAQLLRDTDFSGHFVEAALELARKHLGYTPVATELGRFFRKLGG